jgi:hypothetical protein
MKTDCLPRQLPAPDAYENHWLGEKPCSGPVIFRALVKDRSVNPPADRGWYVSRGDQGGLLFRNGQIRYFPTPEKALEALWEALS